ncbi:MAG: Ppx/GppA family phosphatase [Sphingomonadaceae bacterium]
MTMAQGGLAEGKAAVVRRRVPRTAIIDIGSNSVRLVVYKGLARAPAILFNEKVMAGLGQGLAVDGCLSARSMDMAVTAIARFSLLCEAMQVDSLRAVGTAAVREAKNGPAFVDRVRAETGIGIETISGQTEGLCAALGVIAAIPDADGIVGDLGGGSLELARVAGGEVHERMSLPLGSLRLDAQRKASPQSFARNLDRALEAVEWAGLGAGKPLYAVGGSWRALAHLHMHLNDWPLPVIHQYNMRVDTLPRLARTLAHISPKALKQIQSIPTARGPQLPGAVALLKAVTKRLDSSGIIMSSYGLREGLLYSDLPEPVQRQDPLLANARDEAMRSGRFSDGSDPEIGDALLAFTDQLFPGEPAAQRRIRHAACLLADTTWRAHPDMRAEDGLYLALHGNWVGIDAAERAMLAMTLFVVNGGSAPGPETQRLQRLAPPHRFEQAMHWGLGVRFGQRLAGGSTVLLEGTRVKRTNTELVLKLDGPLASLYGDSARRRHRILAQVLGLEPALRVDGASTTAS